MRIKIIGGDPVSSSRSIRLAADPILQNYYIRTRSFSFRILRCLRYLSSNKGERTKKKKREENQGQDGECKRVFTRETRCRRDRHRGSSRSLLLLLLHRGKGTKIIRLNGVKKNLDARKREGREERTNERKKKKKRWLVVTRTEFRGGRDFCRF